MKKILPPSKSVSLLFSATLRTKSTLLLLLLPILFSSAAFARIRYVKANSPNFTSGESWSEASNDLQYMIDLSNAGDQVWVTGGTYHRNPGNAYQLKSGVSVYGGFAGNEKELWERNLLVTANKSVLLGNGNSVITNVNISGALLNGFTITGGHNDLFGGGIIISLSSVTITNCIIAGNSVGNGDNSFRSAAGISIDKASRLWLINCVISGHASGLAPAIASSGVADLYNCTISGNFVRDTGRGVVVNLGGGAFRARNTIIYGNHGASIENQNTQPSSVTLEYSLVEGVTGTENGNLPGMTNPLFMTQLVPSETPSTDGDYRLQSCSPARNRGSFSKYEEQKLETGFYSRTDLGGWERSFAGAVDMGAYEELTNNSPSKEGIIYVKPGAGGTGESWTCAIGDLQQAIDMSVNGDQIWVAGGTYIPVYPANSRDHNVQSDNRDNAFVLRDGVKLYGGFEGTETSLASRSVSPSRPSILNGDLTGDDNDSKNMGDNAYHVVVLAGGSAILDGFTISGGNANGDGSLNITGETNGLLLERSKGGGIFVYSDGVSSFSNLVIAGNNAKEGGGISLRSTKALTIISSRITGNTASVEGGGMYIYAVAPVLINLTISANVAPKGGGIALEQVGVFQTFRNSVVYRNSGGSVYLGNQSTGFKPQYSLVEDYTASNDHSLPGSAQPLFINPLSPGLSTKGDYQLLPCSPLINSGNNQYLSEPYQSLHTEYDKDITGNNRFFYSIDIGAYEFTSSYPPHVGRGSLTAEDSLVCSDSFVPLKFTAKYGPDQFFTLTINDITYTDVVSGIPFLSKSAITNTTTFKLNSIGVMGDCPATSDIVESSATVTVGSFQASLTGSTICPGGNGSLTLSVTESDTLTAVINGITYDNLLSGIPFEVGNTIDEYTLSSVTWANGCTRTENFTQSSAFVTVRQPIVHYVKQGGKGDGLSWATASGDLQAILNEVCVADTVFVAAGIYKPSGVPSFVSTNDPRDFTFLLINGVKMYGGFAGTETNINQRVRGNVTTLSGNIDNDDDQSDDSYHVVLSVGDNTNAVFDGFTVTGGKAEGEGSLSVGSVSVSRNDGGGMSVMGNAPKISNVIFSSNIARRGGGLSVESGTAAITNANFTNNKTYGDVGGGIFLDAGSSTVLTNCVVDHNTAGGNGGGISSYAATITLSNCIVSNNMGEEGGGMFLLLSTADLVNSTIISNNNNSGETGGVFAKNSAFKARNSVFWRNNMAEISVDIEPGASGTDDVGYSLVDGGYLGESIVNAAPGFVDASNPAGPDGIWRTGDDGLQINCDSPAAEAGTGDTPALDILGIKRANRLDLGAYEAPSSGITSTNTSLTLEQAPNSIVTYGDCANQVATIDGDGPAYNLSGEVTAKVWVESNQPVQYLKRHYQITPVENRETATAKVTLYFTQQDFTDFNTQTPAPALKLPLNGEDAENYKANLRIEKRDGTGDDNGTPGSYTGTSVTIKPSEANGKVEWNAGANRWEVSFDVTGFSGFFIKTIESALPLRLISFTALKEEEGNLLRWSTASEVNTGNFEIQSSTDAKSFKKVALVGAGGSGDHQYSYYDYATYNGTIYYRLKMSDLDRTFTFSRIISLGSDGSATNIYPNPAADAVTFEVSSALLNSTVILYDLMGRKLQSIVITTNPQQVNIGSLTSGFYTLRFANGASGRFVKE
ncbi:T9SS type A sorting domain-containing protein [Dyadobacter sp. CY261]|uniref:right-handed parallel beta-helix repeat-containing protein n=1 Tax=Dyadobacter sp. CY261 TaxID=2907203 RepID=UPI001F2AC239|nr:right-handed parallel beta-helix repeat-containing protein [Dyadobacter sp. CY261]MCF0075754.1 T9SS type A sorting domain-containing protein [Dyadobacter sp. CY261]